MTATVKVAVAGTHSTGKTTFVNRLHGRLAGCGYTVATVSDLGTEAVGRGFRILTEHTPESTLWIMSRGICLELEAGLRADVVLVDRPVPDALGYLRAALAFRGDTCPPRHRDYLHQLAAHHATTYHLVFKTRLDPTIPLGDDKPRDTDGRFRELADRAITDLFADLDLAWQPLTPNGHHTAIDRVLDFLGTDRPHPVRPHPPPAGMMPPRR